MAARRTGVAALLTCALAACGGAHGSTAKPDASFSDLLRAGTQLLAQGKDAAAVVAFQQAIAKQPKSAVGYYDLGVVYGREGQRHKSVVQYARALKANPNYVPALYNYGVALETKRPLASIYFFQRVIQLHPESPTALLNLGLMTYSTSAARPHALRLLKRAVILQPSLYSAIPTQLRSTVRHTKLPKPSNTRNGGD